MRAVLSLALVLFVLTLVLNHARELLPGPAQTDRADRALEIVVGAKGPLLPLARLGAGPERIGEVIRLGNRTLVGTGQPGLRAVFLGPAFDVRAERCFDAARSSDDARALRAAVEDCGDGELVVLASSGRLQPEDGSPPQAELESALALLGAWARPGNTSPESWALIALRLERGWVPLAEAYSRDSGVALAFTLSPDLEAYADFEGDLALVRAGSRAEVLLEEELRHASLLTSGVERVGRATVQGQPFTAVLVPTLEDESGRAVPGSIVWKDVAIGSESAVFAFLGLADGADPDSDGVVFAVRVDGELVGSQAVQPGARWKSKLFDLRRFAGRNVALELSVDPRQTAIGDSALWGRPVLVHGLDRSPLEAWAAER